MNRMHLQRRLRRFFLAAALAAMVLGAQDDKPLRSDDFNSLRRRALEAKRSGQTAIAVAAPDSETAQPEPLAEALAHTTLILARFVGRATTHDDDFVWTWRKYRLLERFSIQPVVWQEADEPFAKFIPAALLPIEPGEFVMAECAGTAVVDGVAITMRRSAERILPETPPLLMFLVLASSGKVAALNYGSPGAFWIDESEAIHAVDGSSGNHLWAELLERSGGKLSGVRLFVNSRGQPR